MKTRKPAERAYRLAVTPIRNVVVRDASATGDGSWTVEGYAAVYEQETLLFDLSWWRVREEIARGAFTTVLEAVKRGDELVHLNFGHDMNTSVAASNVSGIGGLELEEDFHGLRFFARVDRDDPDAHRLAMKMQRGIVAQASFAFTIGAEEIVEDEYDAEDDRWDTKYRILEISHLYDVCACPQGAYPQTESHLRSLAAASLGRAGIDPAGFGGRTPPVGRERRPDPEQGDGGAADVASATTGGSESKASALERLRAHANATVRNLERRVP